MLAGMWGIRGGLSDKNMVAINNYENLNYYTVDQVYLSEHVFIECDTYISGILEDEIFAESRLLIGKDFVGQGYDENENAIYPII